jgi:phosphate transport system substrate-binding protein
MTCAFSFALAEDMIRIYGATTVADALNQNKYVVEDKLGCKLLIVGNTAGTGLIYLDEGKCDIALTATSLENTIAAAKIGRKDIKPDGLVVTLLKDDELAFIVNPINNITKLTDSQLKYVLSGWYSNWKDVGGMDLPIIVLADKPTGATRSLINKEILKDADFSPKTKDFLLHSAMVDEVSTTPGAIAGVSKVYINDKVKVIETRKLSRPLAVITKGEPSGKVKEVIDTYKSLIK